MDSSLRITSSSISDRGLSEKRPQNEDSFLEKPEIGLFAVADGVGGAQAGEVASQLAVEMLGEAFAHRQAFADSEAVMRAAIEEANAAIHRMADELPQLSSMASTIVALHLDGQIATIGHVGDSRLYRVDRQGNLFLETADHSVVGEEVRAGRMTPEQAASHPSRNVISRAVGAESGVEVDLKTMMVDHGTIFLLCSDGITRHVTDQEIERVLNFSASPEDACTHLRNMCFDRGAEDNLTAVVVKVSGGEASPAPPDEAVISAEHDEDTVATARHSFESQGDSLLEMETRELKLPELDTLPAAVKAESEPAGAASEPAESIRTVEGPTLLPSIVPPIEPKKESPANEDFKMFGGAAGDSAAGESAGSGGSRLLMSFVMLVLGSLIGIGVYHFAIAPKAAQVNDQGLSVMRSDDIAFSSFEKNRRNVDADPAAYIREVPPPKGAEDQYLRGRAFLLMGDFANARQAFIAAQKELGDVERANEKVLITDIASGLIIVNDPALLPRFKQLVEDNARAHSTASTER